MKFVYSIFLIDTNDRKIKVNDIGDIEPSFSKRKVFAHKKDIRQSEFYQAQAIGFKPELTFVIRRESYGGEKLLEFNKEEYDIIRTFDDGKNIELIISRGVNHGDSTKRSKI